VVSALVAGDIARVRAHSKKRNAHVHAGGAADDFEAQREERLLDIVDPAVAAAVAAQAREMRALEAQRVELAVELKGLRAGRERCRQRGTVAAVCGSVAAATEPAEARAASIKALLRLY
jgi:hypothetical protein